MVAVRIDVDAMHAMRLLSMNCDGPTHLEAQEESPHLSTPLHTSSLRWPPPTWKPRKGLKMCATSLWVMSAGNPSTLTTLDGTLDGVGASGAAAEARCDGIIIAAGGGKLPT